MYYYYQYFTVLNTDCFWSDASSMTGGVLSGGKMNVTNVDACHQKCRETPECKFFTFKAKSSKNNCFLKSDGKNGRTTGPRSCPWPQPEGGSKE